MWWAGSRAGAARRSEPLTRPTACIRSGSRARQSIAAPGSRAVRRRGLPAFGPAALRMEWMVIDDNIGALDPISMAREGAAHAHGAARLLMRARCATQVLLCRRCDRGQRYCSVACSAAARREHQREAARRYQRSPRGRAAHEARSRRWRLAQSADSDTGLRVTHHGGSFEPTTVNDAVPPQVSQGNALLFATSWLNFECVHCLRALPAWLRQGPSRRARQRPRRRAPPPTAQAAGP